MENSVSISTLQYNVARIRVNSKVNSSPFTALFGYQSIFDNISRSECVTISGLNICHNLVNNSVIVNLIKTMKRDVFIYQ